MARLFLKFYGVLIATLLLSFVVQGQLIDYVYLQLAPHFDFRARFRPTFHLLEEALAGLPAERAAERFAALASGFGMPARLAAAGELPERARLGPEQRAAFEDGAIVSIDRPAGFTVAKRLRGTPFAAALDVPGPDSKRIRLVTYAVNWTVEFTVVAILVWFWVRPFWTELTSLRAAAERIGEGRFEARAAAGRRSALRDLAVAFNTMAERLAGLVQSHRTLTSAVSHELRSPLARLRFAHSLALETADAAAKDRFLARMERDIAEIDALTSELLDYARLERGTPRLDRQAIPAAPWLEDVVASVREGDRGMPSVETAVDVEGIEGEPRYLARAVANLLRNAARHARSRIRVRVGREGARTVIEVEDDGPGIAPGDRERLFEPFERADRHRDRDSGGFGLGLAIVRQVARWHGGEARIGESPLGGARITLAW